VRNDLKNQRGFSGFCAKARATTELAARLLPLCNLWVQALQHLGIATKRFGTSKGTSIKGLEVS